MKNLALLLPFILFVSCSTPMTHEQQQKDADRLISSMVESGSAGVTVAVAQGDRILYSQGHGFANPEYEILNSPQTIFHVASLSKQFTAFAIALLAEKGKISLDDDIRKYLPELADFGHKITIKHLVHHTSGLRDQWELLALAGWRLDDVITRNQVLRLISHQKELNFKPGEEFSYCNTGYTLLGEIVSRVTGETFPEWCRKNIFEPLDMDHTFFYDDHEKIVKNRAYSYQDTPDGLKKSVLSYANAGATSLFTTAEDLTKWSDNFYSMNVGNEQVMKQMAERGVLNKGDTLAYAFGQGSGTYKSLRNFAHGGADAGYRTFLLRFPEHKLSIVVLSNLASFQTGKLAFGLADIYLKEHLREEPQPTAAQQTAAVRPTANEESFDSQSLDVNAYEGSYYSPELQTRYTVEANGNTLIANHIRHEPLEMVPVAEDAFSTQAWFMSKIQFTRNEKAEVTGFTVSSGRIRNVKFVKTTTPDFTPPLLSR